MLNASAAKSSKASLPAGWRATRYPRRHVCLASSVAPAKSSIETLVMAVENGKNQSAMSATKSAVQSRLGSGNFLTQIIDLLRRKGRAPINKCSPDIGHHGGDFLIGEE